MDVIRTIQSALYFGTRVASIASFLVYIIYRDDVFILLGFLLSIQATCIKWEAS
ncbi:hypothetical protein LCGC14_0744020 [marine sediment metagenome]|uniref:Uncharacterized protein n=1 Tax=marine sediment metagenome TaxID=412755 RepID=A0A0F9TD01_9ZZZZ